MIVEGFRFKYLFAKHAAKEFYQNARAWFAQRSIRTKYWMLRGTALGAGLCLGVIGFNDELSDLLSDFWDGASSFLDSKFDLDLSNDPASENEVIVGDESCYTQAQDGDEELYALHVHDTNDSEDSSWIIYRYNENEGWIEYTRSTDDDFTTEVPEGHYKIERYIQTEEDNYTELQNDARGAYIYEDRDLIFPNETKIHDRPEAEIRYESDPPVYELTLVGCAGLGLGLINYETYRFQQECKEELEQIKKNLGVDDFDDSELEKHIKENAQDALEDKNKIKYKSFKENDLWKRKPKKEKRIKTKDEFLEFIAQLKTAKSKKK